MSIQFHKNDDFFIHQFSYFVWYLKNIDHRDFKLTDIIVILIMIL